MIIPSYTQFAKNLIDHDVITAEDWSTASRGYPKAYNHARDLYEELRLIEPDDLSRAITLMNQAWSELGDMAQAGATPYELLLMMPVLMLVKECLRALEPHLQRLKEEDASRLSALMAKVRESTSNGRAATAFAFSRRF